MAPVSRRSFLAGLIAAPVLGVIALKAAHDGDGDYYHLTDAELRRRGRYVFNTRTGDHGRCLCGVTLNGVPVTCDFHRELGVKYLGRITSL